MAGGLARLHVPSRVIVATLRRGGTRLLATVVIAGEALGAASADVDGLVVRGSGRRRAQRHLRLAAHPGGQHR